MIGLKNRVQRRTEDLWDQTSRAMAHPVRTVERRPWTVVGLIAAIFGVAAFIWLFPELRRYIRIERM